MTLTIVLKKILKWKCCKGAKNGTESAQKISKMIYELIVFF